MTCIVDSMEIELFKYNERIAKATGTRLTPVEWVIHQLSASGLKVVSRLTAWYSNRTDAAVVSGRERARDSVQAVKSYVVAGGEQNWAPSRGSETKGAAESGHAPQSVTCPPRCKRGQKQCRKWLILAALSRLLAL
jgi:hypothetical protein